MTRKTALITGATGGIGQATAITLAERGYTVILVGRDSQRLESLKQHLTQQFTNCEIAILKADLSSLEQVRTLAATVSEQFPKLDVLINNAGVTPNVRQESQDGFELQFAVNFLAPFLLTQLLLPTLRKNAPARIINVASSAARMGKLKLQDLQSAQRYDMTAAYAQSKLALLMFTVSLAAQLEPREITVNALDPGWTESAMTRGMERGGGLLGIVNRIGKLLPLRQNTTRGAHNSVYLASDTAVQGISGQFYSALHKLTPMPAAVNDAALREGLWRMASEFVGLPSNVVSRTASQPVNHLQERLS